MKTIIKSASFFANIIGEQKPEEKADYIASKFLVSTPVDNGYLVYNTLLGNLFFLENREFDCLQGKTTNEAVSEVLIKKWMLVKKDADEYKNYLEYKNVYRSLKQKTGYDVFTILSTTDCNARCYYCYQHGIEHFSMTEETAKEAAKFIIKNHNGNILLRFFGGEPLYNKKAIEIICKELNSNGMLFSSTMITNGLLFDEQTINNAIENWHLKKVQITLDGTRDVYNTTKAYIDYKGKNAFDNVINHIKTAANAGLKVDIRLNVSEKNVDDLTELVEYLYKEFGANTSITVYTALLYDLRSNPTAPKDTTNKIKKLNDLIFEYGLFNRDIIATEIKTNNCMADNDNAINIGPRGELLKCEHYNQDKILGSIFGEEVNKDIINEFKQEEILEDCYSCPFLVNCNMLKNCENHLSFCTEYKKLQVRSQLLYKMKNSYRKYCKQEENK